MFAVNFYASCFVSRGNSIGKRLTRLDWEKVIYWPLFTLANNLLSYLQGPMHMVNVMSRSTKIDLKASMAEL